MAKWSIVNPVQETARIYYHNLVDFYPQGPYLLLGHCAEGYFVLELARWLIQSGQEVAFLGLLDSYPPGHGNLVNRVKLHITLSRIKILLKFWCISEAESDVSRPAGGVA